MPQVTLDSTILEKLLKRAASAARRVSDIEDEVGYIAVDLLAEDIDAIVHELSELLGNPTLIVSAPNELAPVPDSVALVNALSDEEPTRLRVRRLRRTRSRHRQHVGRIPTTIETEVVFPNPQQPRAQRALMNTDARSTARWMRTAGVAALTLLVGLALWVLGGCGGVR
jgi:hypothetical protein